MPITRSAALRSDSEEEGEHDEEDQQRQVLSHAQRICLDPAGSDLATPVLSDACLTLAAPDAAEAQASGGAIGL